MTLTLVRHDVAVEPLSLRTFVRTVAAEDLASEPMSRTKVGAAGYRSPSHAPRELAGRIDTRGDRAYTLVVDWGMGICGSRIPREVDLEVC